MVTIEVRKQNCQTMALKMTRLGPVALIPLHLDGDCAIVLQFVQDALANLPEPEYRTMALRPGAIDAMVADWAERLKVEVKRVQVRPMRDKWSSISSAGTLNLADHLAHLPEDLVEYVIVHELLHLTFPDHHQGWRVSIGMWLPDWEERERRLQRYLPE